MAKKKSAKTRGAARKVTRKAAATRKTAKRPKATKRASIAPRGDTRYVRRDKAGRISESDGQGRSLATDTRRKAKRKVKSGQGDRGDR